jgi:hypothetical protein
VEDECGGLVIFLGLGNRDGEPLDRVEQGDEERKRRYAVAREG